MGRYKRSKESKIQEAVAVPSKMGEGELILQRREPDGRVEILASGRDNCLQALDTRGLFSEASESHMGPAGSEEHLPAMKYEPTGALTKSKTTLPKHSVKHPLSADNSRAIPRDAGSSQTYGCVESTDEDEPVPDRRTTQSFKISDDDKVKKYLHSRLVLLQQQADKRIAKAWIKGICPKKQARYPYQNSQRRERDNMDPVVPEWWPAELCEFKEPDHISKESRMALCLHLLRLRPTVAQLKEWNGNGEVTELCKTHELCGWTAFLRQLTPNSIFDGLEPDKPDKRRLRETILEQMYDVAEKEERFLEDECDGDTSFHWDEEPEAPRPGRSVPSKRSRQSSAVSDGKPGSVEHSGSERGSKRTRRNTQKCDGSPNAHLALQMSKAMLAEAHCAISTDCSPSRDAMMTSAHDFAPGANDYEPAVNIRHQKSTTPYSGQSSRIQEVVSAPFPRYASVDYGTSSYCGSPAVGTPISTAFGFNHVEMQDPYEPGFVQEGTTAFPGRQDYAFAQLPPTQKFVQAYYASDTPQSYVDTAPTTPSFSPTPVSQRVFPGQEGAVCAGQREPMVSYVTGSHRYQIDERGLLRHEEQCHAAGGQRGPPGFAVSQPYSVRSPMRQPQQECCDSKPFNQQYQAYHGLPTQYHEVQQPPMHDGRHYVYTEARPDSNFPAASLPGSVERGFTGHGSGIGGGAWV